MRVITLTGPKRSGKNTMADLVGEELGALGVELRQAAFADPLRWAGDAIGLPTAATRELKDQPCDELGGHTGREFLIEFGTTCVRGLCPTFWVDHMVRRLDALEAADPSQPVAITDLRFANELDALEAWSLAKPGRWLAAVWVERRGATADEILEPRLRERCAVIGNAGTLADLRVRAAAIAEWAAGGSSRRIGGRS